MLASGWPGTCYHGCADHGPDVKVKFNVATELRDNTDQLCAGPLYSVFLKKLVPVFKKLLEGPPVFMSTSWEHVCSYPVRFLASATDQESRNFETASWRSFIGSP